MDNEKTLNFQIIKYDNNNNMITTVLVTISLCYHNVIWKDAVKAYGNIWHTCYKGCS